MIGNRAAVSRVSNVDGENACYAEQNASALALRQ
jgi:hypothetical protein